MNKLTKVVVATVAAIGLSLGVAGPALAAPKEKPAPVASSVTAVKTVSVAYVNSGAGDATNTFIVTNNSSAPVEVHYNYYLKYQYVLGAQGDIVIPANATVVLEYARQSGAVLQAIPVVNGLPDYLNRAQAYAL